MRSIVLLLVAIFFVSALAKSKRELSSFKEDPFQSANYPDSADAEAQNSEDEEEATSSEQFDDNERQHGQEEKFFDNVYEEADSETQDDKISAEKDSLYETDKQLVQNFLQKRQFPFSFPNAQSASEPQQYADQFAQQSNDENPQFQSNFQMPEQGAEGSQADFSSPQQMNFLNNFQNNEVPQFSNEDNVPQQFASFQSEDNSPQNFQLNNFNAPQYSNFQADENSPQQFSNYDSADNAEQLGNFQPNKFQSSQNQMNDPSAQLQDLSESLGDASNIQLNELPEHDEEYANQFNPRQLAGGRRVSDFNAGTTDNGMESFLEGQDVDPEDLAYLHKLIQAAEKEYA